MNTDTIDTYKYSDSDFIYQTVPWTDKETSQLSKFDIELQKRWNKAMASGVFRYGIDHIITRIIPGSKRYVGQLNILRATERRKPQDISSVNQPFNDKAFSFSMVKSEEIIFNLQNVSSLQENSQEASVTTTKTQIENSLCCDGHHCEGSNGISTTSFADSKASDKKEGPACQDLTSVNQNNGEVITKPERHLLIVNVSPMEFGHCLLVPEIDSHRPQVLTQTSIQVAIETMLLSAHRGIRMGFNSLCAFASVNHLHFHLYYLEHELIVDYHPVHHLGGRYFEFNGLPCPGFAVQLYGSTVAEMARLTHRISSYFQENDIAHNVFLCRGNIFSEERNSTLTTVRLYIWPRKKFIGKKSSEEFNVACIELGGHLPIKEEAGYHSLTESEVDAIIADACLPPEQYKNVREHVIAIGLEEMEALKRSL